MQNSAELSEAEEARRTDEDWRKIREENGFAWSPAELKQLLDATDLSPENTLASGLKLGAAIGLSGVDGKTVGQAVASQIKTQEQLDSCCAVTSCRGWAKRQQVNDRK